MKNFNSPTLGANSIANSDPTSNFNETSETTDNTQEIKEQEIKKLISFCRSELWIDDPYEIAAELIKDVSANQELFLGVLDQLGLDYNMLVNMAFDRSRNPEHPGYDLIGHIIDNIDIDNKDSIINLNRAELANKLLESENYSELVDNLEKFEGAINVNKLADKLLKSKNYSLLVDNIEKFQKINRNKLGILVYEYLWLLDYALMRRPRSECVHNELAIKLIETHREDLLVTRL